MRVAFYIHGFSPKNGFDAASLLCSNPGLGGTEYVVILVAYSLQQRNNDIDVVIYSTEGNIIKGMNDVEQVEGISDAIARGNNENIDYLIFCHDSQLIQNGHLYVKSPYTKLIVWCHNFATWKELDYYADDAKIWKIVNVGREQRDLFIDHRSFSKSVYIYNCLGIEESRRHDISIHQENIVTYMGCVWPRKGFHWLADEWKKVLQAVPDAQLYVIGSGKLYGWDMKMGPLGIAEASYERRITYPLSENGILLPSVHFMGIMGDEKYDILAKTKVGVPNPTGNTETFCITAVEMQAMGAYVVMGKCPGALDTVINGRIINRKKSLAPAIISALKSRPGYDCETYQMIHNRFSVENVIRRWESLLLEGQLDDETVRNINYRWKWLKILIGKINRNHHRIPSIERILLIIERHMGGNRSMYQYVPKK